MQGPIDESYRLLLGISERRLISVRINADGMVCKFDWWETADLEEMKKFTIEQLERIKKQEKTDVNAIEIWFMHTEAMFIPATHFDPNRLSSMLDVVYGPAPLSQIKIGKTNTHDLMHVFRIESKLDQTLNQLFPDATRDHVLRSFPSHTQPLEIPIKLTVYATEIRVHIQQEDKVILHQVYTYSSREDVLYRLLTICNSLNLQPEHTVISASGMMSIDSALFELLHRSFASIEFEEADFPLHQGLNADSFPAHLFSPILAFTS